MKALSSCTDGSGLSCHLNLKIQHRSFRCNGKRKEICILSYPFLETKLRKISKNIKSWAQIRR